MYQKEGGRNISKSVKLLLGNIKRKKTPPKHIKVRMLKTLENARFLLCTDHRGQVVSPAQCCYSTHITQAVSASSIAKQHHATLPQLIQGREVDSGATEKGRI